MSWIQTFTGRKVDPLNIKASDIAIEDIAHSLALTNRYTGHTPKPYSVAQHSVYVAQQSWREHSLWGLLHDAPEAYLADISRPVKLGLREAKCTLLDEIDRRIMDAVCERFNLPQEEPKSVKRADLILLSTEAISFFGQTKLYAEWHHQPGNGYCSIDPAVIVPWDWRDAEAAFLAAFSQLYGSRVFNGKEAAS